MIYLKEFATDAAYEAAKDNLLIPNVSLITENGEVKYKKGSEPDTTLVMKIITTSDSQSFQVFDMYYSSSYKLINYIEIDGEEKNIATIIEDYGYFTATTAGEHTVKMRFTPSNAIPENVLVDCKYTSMYIPDGLTILGDNFIGFEEETNNLESISVNVNNPNYDSRNNCNAVIETSTNKLLRGCKNTIIPNDVTIIDDRAFRSVQGLQNIEISNNVTEIGAHAFRYNNVIETVDIGNSIAYISSQAFANCPNLTSVTIRATTPPTLPAYAYLFDKSPCTIYVPSGSVEAYKAAEGWSTYADRIQAIP